MLFVDTSVWSLALRRDRAADEAPVAALRRAVADGQLLCTTGIVLQELLQGRGLRADTRAAIAERFAGLIHLHPRTEDHERAAEVFARCRAAGMQLGTIDALIAALCIQQDVALLTADRDFERAAEVVPLRLAG